jgi:hypothetical protein
MTRENVLYLLLGIFLGCYLVLSVQCIGIGWRLRKRKEVQ